MKYRLQVGPLFSLSSVPSFYGILNTETITIWSPVTTLLAAPPISHNATTLKIGFQHLLLLTTAGSNVSAQNTGLSTILTWGYPFGFISLWPTNPTLHSLTIPNLKFTENAEYSSSSMHLCLFVKCPSVNFYSYGNSADTRPVPTVWECKLKSKKRKHLGML